MDDQERIALRILRKNYKGENFMTPDIVSIGMVNGMAYEISSGRTFMDGSTLYGVSICEEGGARHDLSKSFYIRKAAFDYIEQLRNGEME